MRKSILWALGTIWLAGPLAVSLSGGTHDVVREVGSRVELFVDDWLIARMDNLRLAMHRPRPAEVAIDFDRPWEGGYSAYVTVFQDGDRFRMYYRGIGTAEDAKQVYCYAESRDGVHWTRPSLGLHSYNGSTDNNIVLTGKGSHNFAPFKDSNPEAPADQRYKALGGGPLLVFASADGLNWRQVQEEPVISDGAFDSQNLAFWDPGRRKYVAFYRDFIRPVGSSWKYSGVRAIKTATSADFFNWTEGRYLDYEDAPLEHFYTNAITPYPRAPHIYLGFPKRFMPTRIVRESDEALFQAYWKELHEPGRKERLERNRKRAAAAGHSLEDWYRIALFGGVSDAVLISSRDGYRFQRTFREGFVRAGLDQGNWGHRNNMTAWGILRTGPEEISLYLGEHYELSTCRLRRHTLRVDGFASVHADFGGGSLLTHPLTFDGKELVLNYSTSAVGYVKVGLQDELGRPVPGLSLNDCPEIYGDEIERVVRWNGDGDLGDWSGKTVRLVFEMKDADLYSIRFR